MQAAPMQAAPHLLLTRPLPQAQDTARQLIEAGFRVTLAPMLAIRPLAHPPLATPVSAVLLTSQHAADALPSLVSDRETPVFAVGRRTAEAAGAQGFRQVLAAQDHADDLLRLVSERLPSPAPGPLLYLRGAQVRQDLAGPLSTQGHQLIERIVYEAQPVAQLPPEALSALTEGRLHGLVFFSARTVEAFFQALQGTSPMADLRKLRTIAISETVAEAARNHGLDDILILPLQRGRDQAERLKILFSSPPIATSGPISQETP